MNTKPQEPNESANLNQPDEKHDQHDENVPVNNRAGIPPQPVFGDQGEAYLRESSNIEDMPDEKDMEAYDDKIRQEEEDS